MLKINDWRLFFLLLLSLGTLGLRAASEDPAYSHEAVELLLKTGEDKGQSAFGESPTNSDSSDGERVRVKVKKTSPKVKKKKGSRGFDSIGDISDVDRDVANSISRNIQKIVVDQADEDNETWQKQIAKTKAHYRKKYERELAKKSLGSVSADTIDEKYAEVWLDGMNKVVEIEAGEEDNGSDELDFSDNEEDEADATRVKRTTVFNIALRYGLSEAVDKEDYLKKILTLVDNGADKNLNPHFTSGSMINQPEIPLQIVFRELTDNELVNELLERVFFDDSKSFKLGKAAYESDRNRGAIESIEKDYEYLLGKLYDEKNFSVFSRVLHYLEIHEKFITEDYDDKTAGIEDQVKLPLLYKVLKDMRAIREKSLSLDEEGNRKDNIAEFFNWSVVRNSLNRNYDTMFGHKLQSQLQRDYDKEFRQMAKVIDDTRSTTDLKGRELKGMVFQWTVMANFRNRLAFHLNRYALTAANEGARSNVVKLVRYARMSDKEENRTGQTNDDAIYAELAVLDGLDAIFLRPNPMRWTPLMYAMSQRQSDGLQLLLHQAVHPITVCDGVGNNLLHLAFPLPEKFLTSTENKDNDNPLAQVGAGIGEEGFVEKTTHCIMAVLTADNNIPGTETLAIPEADKIAALTKKSALNFTPVSLAAMTGFYKLYDEMSEFLNARGAWFEEDHSRIGYHVEELVVKGMENFRNQKVELSKLDPSKGWSGEEDKEILSEIAKRKRILANKYDKAIRRSFTKDSALAKARYQEIEDAGESYLKHFNSLSVKEQTGNPYAEALNRAMDAMINPKSKTVEQTYVDSGAAVVQASQPKKKDFWDLFKKEEAVPEQRVQKKKETKTVVVASVLEGMPQSTSDVQASYLRPYFEKIVRLFLEENEAPHQFPLDVAYQRLTKRKKNFFRDAFGSKVIETRMMETLEKVLRELDRLHLTEEEVKEEESRFSAIERQRRDADSEEEYESEEEDSDDDSSWYDEDDDSDDGSYYEDSDEDSDESEYETDSDED